MEYIWHDRKRHLGLPISFAKYRLTTDRLFCETGVLNLKEEEILLYRVRDIGLTRTFWQRLFRVGTICIHSTDKTAGHLDIVNVRDPRDVKELIFKYVEEAKEKRRMRATELLGAEKGLDAGEGTHEDIETEL